MTQDECDSINAFQNCGVVHPLTCVTHSQLEPLEARQDGFLHCLHCDYRQFTPGGYLADWHWKKVFGAGTMAKIMEHNLNDYHERTGRPIGPKENEHV
jgi:hypothetical protein